MRNESGFTILSVLVAMILLSVGVVSLMRSLGAVTTAHTGAAARTTALAVARAHMEEVRSKDPRTVKVEVPVQVNAEGKTEPTGRFTRSVDVESVSQHLRRITVRVDYPNARQPVELVTLSYVSGFAGK